MTPETPPGVFNRPADLEAMYAPPEGKEPISLFPLGWYEFFLQEIKRLDKIRATFRKIQEGLKLTPSWRPDTEIEEALAAFFY